MNWINHTNKFSTFNVLILRHENCPIHNNRILATIQIYKVQHEIMSCYVRSQMFKNTLSVNRKKIYEIYEKIRIFFVLLYCRHSWQVGPWQFSVCFSPSGTQAAAELCPDLRRCESWEPEKIFTFGEMSAQAILKARPNSFKFSERVLDLEVGLYSHCYW